MPRVAIVLFNLGGPDNLEAVRPFLLNLFKDPAILRVPFFVRPILARVIARARVKPATEIYKIMGGRSPLLELTNRQARALEAELAADPGADDRSADGWEFRCFVAMRYWHPFADEVVAEVKAFAPDRVLLLPLYPQYSTTTSGSSVTDWRSAAAIAGFVAPTTTLCCWHADRDFISATAAIIRDHLAELRLRAGPGIALRILFSAHGLPEVIVKRGDPYEMQVERTAAAILRTLRAAGVTDEALGDAVVCYQSRATPQKWLQPSTDAEIERAGRECVGLLVVPIAFVSEHSETLVELDVEYRELAAHSGVPFYRRVPAQNDDPGFITALAGIVRRALDRGPGLCSSAGQAVCPRLFSDCPHALARKPVALDAAE